MATKGHAQLEAHLGSLALQRGIQPRHVEAALTQYKAHLRSLPPEKVEELSSDDDKLDAHAGNFFEGAAETAPDPDDDPGASSSSSSSSASTGGSSSMNRESRESLRKRGISWS